MPIRAAFFDFGGVVLSSPFDAFNGFEERTGLPRDFIRTINSTNILNSGGSSGLEPGRPPENGPARLGDDV